ncbi:hypothetical protein ABT186_15815 [Streptomyces sp. NPDC001634]|uniref:hypothetical protein n=1 Tax=Streptomyces sp. NPDC001634 TaxID=3154390 RepID=UPI00331FF1BF
MFGKGLGLGHGGFSPRLGDDNDGNDYNDDTSAGGGSGTDENIGENGVLTGTGHGQSIQRYRSPG